MPFYFFPYLVASIMIVYETFLYLSCYIYPTLFFRFNLEAFQLDLSLFSAESFFLVFNALLPFLRAHHFGALATLFWLPGQLLIAFILMFLKKYWK